MQSRELVKQEIIKEELLQNHKRGVITTNKNREELKMKLKNI